MSAGPARAHEPTDKVLSQLNLIQCVALGLNSRHLTVGIPSMTKREGWLAHAPLASYALWVHSHSFITAVCHPHVYDASHVESFQYRAGRVGLVLNEVTLPYIQLAPVNIKKPSFLQGALRAYLRVQRGGGVYPPNGHLAFSIFQGRYSVDICVPTTGEKGCLAMVGVSGGRRGAFGAFG